MPETLGGAGVSFAPKDLEQAAELLGGLVYDEPFRAAVIAGTAAPAARTSAATARIALADMLDAVLEI